MSNDDARPGAGWYPAAHANGEQRYWNGDQWLEGDVPAVPAVQGAEGVASTGKATSDNQKPRRRNGMSQLSNRLFPSRAALAWAIAAGVLLMGVGAVSIVAASYASSTTEAEQQVADLTTQVSALDGQVSDLEADVSSCDVQGGC